MLLRVLVVFSQPDSEHLSRYPRSEPDTNPCATSEITHHCCFSCFISLENMKIRVS